MAPMLEPATDETIRLPAGFAQERLWFLDRLRPGTAVYNMPVSIRLASRISRAVLERSLAELVRRHEALRTTFTAEAGRVVQIVSAARPLPLAVVDLRHYPRHEREARLDDLAAAESRRAFDLGCGPLVRATLYRLAAADHVLLLVMHHIVSDAWSMEVLVRELGTLYAAFDAGGPSPLTPLPIQYADWAQWQRERLDAGALETELAFWREQLEGAPTLLDLPSDSPRPALSSGRGALETVVVEAAVAERLRALARRHRCTLYMVLLAAFGTLLGRYARKADVLIGSPVTSRNSPDVESVVGLFVNTVVMRVDLRGAPTVADLLERIRTMVVGVHAHSEVPLDKVIETLHPERSAGHPLFQVFFSLQASASAVRVPGRALPDRRSKQPAAVTTGTSKFDLSLLVTDTPHGLGCGWEYSLDLFEAARMRRMSGHFVRLLTAFADTPDAPLSDLPMTGVAEARELAVMSRGPRRPSGRRSGAGRAGCLHDRVLEQSRFAPDALAVEAGRETLSYAALVASASELAVRLRARGVGPEARVGLYVGRDANLAVAALGILQAGGAYVPLDPAHPRERLAYIANDAKLAWVVTTAAMAPALPDGVRPLCLDRPDDIPPKDSPPPTALPGNLAYVLYTSGTTGRPKGVAVTHASAVALLEWASAAFDPADRARVLASTSICFDLSVFEIFLPLTEGGTAVITENILSLASPAAPDVTLVNTVPSAMRELLRFWRPGPSLRTINLAGEVLASDLVRGLLDRAPGVTVNNLYGPTETTVYSTAARLAPADRLVPPIGRPIAGTDVYVLDDRLTPVPVGVPGELYISGAGLARGYLERPALTAGRYLPDPFAGAAGERMYRTGDLACWRADGMLEYRGRVDQQVKLRGHRIELGEIESALREHASVRDAVAALRDTPGGDACLVAYITTDAPAPSPGELEAVARRALPPYMVPSKLVFLEGLPRTATGKVDRSALPPPPWEPEVSRRGPAMDAEAALCQLFAEALGSSDFDPDGDFFARGGHSLLATRVVARASEVLGVDLPLSSIFEHPTPAQLSAFAATAQPGRARAAARRQPAVDTRGTLPLSFAQEGMWFYDRLRPGTALYNLPTTVPVRGAIDERVLQRSLDRVVARHEALRMRFDMVNGAPVQRVDEDARVKLALHDLTDLALEERGTRAQRIVERDSRRPFHLGRAPLLRASLVRLSPREQLLLLVMHHIIADGWSADVLLRDLMACYEAFSRGSEPALPALPLQYRDYVLWQRSTLTPAVLSSHIAYFRDRLAGAPAAISLPGDRARPGQPSFKGGLISFEIGDDASAAMAAVAAAHGVTLHMAYLAVFGAFLHQYSDQNDVVIGIPIANRSRPEWKDLIGLFVNALPVRIACGGEPTFAAILGRVREAAVGAYAREEVPFDRLVQELSPAREPGHNPIFQVTFGLQELEARNDLPPASADLVASTGVAKFDLSLTLSRTGHRVAGVFEYATDLFERGTIERMALRYRHMVKSLAACPDRALNAVVPIEVEDRPGRVVSDAGARRLEDASTHAQTGAGRASPAGDGDLEAAARAGIERQISMIWAEVLGHSDFRPDQSFFEVGGHSLAAVCVMVRVAEQWGVDISFDRMFTAPSIEALARAVEAARAEADRSARDVADDRSALRRMGRGAAVPLSFAQERLWFLDQLAPGLPVYNIPFAIRFEGTVDISALERSFERLGERHECLRARFRSGEAGPEQVFDPVMTVDLAATDLTHLPAATRAAEAERLQALEARRAFDLEHGPLLRTCLLRLGPRDHVLLVTLHHIVADARSIEILQRDLAALFEAETTGAPEALPDLPVQYADFAIWQRAWLRGERLDAEVAHWKQKMAGAPPLLALPTDRPRPHEQSYEGARLPVTIGDEPSAAIRRLAKDEQATPFMVLLGIFCAVLGRWSGTTDIVVGTPVIGRPHRHLEELIGFFSNTLLVRADLGACRTFRMLLRHVRQAVIEALAHQDLPFEAIVHELRSERTLAHNPLFQVMFAFQQPPAAASGDRPRTGSTQRSQGHSPGAGAASATAKFDLTLFLADEPEFHGVIEYRTDLFDAATIERFGAHLRAAAAAAVACPDAVLDQLFLAGASERAAVERWNATTARFEQRDSLAAGLFAAQAVRSPSAPAVSFGTATWTYGELMRRAWRLARRLRALGVGPDSRVAIAAEPSLHLVAATLGIWRAGGACVPLDPSYPAERLAFMAKDCGARWLVGPRDVASVAPTLDLVRVEQDADEREDSPLPDALDREGVASPEQLAYVIYTSGSTGRPKGVAMTHAALINLVLWQRSGGARDAALRTLQFASPSFDVYFQEVLLCLATGGELIIAGRDERRDPALLVDLCRDRRAERMFLPYVALRALAEAGAHRAPLSDLREVITAGEQLRVTPALRRWFSAHRSCRLFNHYGPSETHVVTEERLPPDPAGWRALPPIGRPIANARLYVLDEALHPVPVGVPGDLYLGGRCLARGYLDQPAPTAERFLPDPFGTEAGARMYRSGDRARWLTDGRVDFLGRSDDQVKVRGYRVEVAEVETVLSALPHVRQAVVAAAPGPDGETRLVGHVLADDASVDPADLRAALSRVLPEPLVPAVLVMVDDFPRTPSGKVDRRALPAPPVDTRARREPAGEIERMLARTWCDVLGIEHVGPDDNFFVLGGHSLTAARVTVRLRERLDADVPVRWIFEHPTIARLASALAAARPGEEGGSLAGTIDIEPRARDGSPLPCSFAQERLWFLDRVAPGDPAYNLTSSSALPPSVDVDALHRSLDEVVRRHEALRTVFREVDGHPVQIVAPTARAALEVVDLSYLPAHEADTEARERAEEEARRPFDLAAGPLFRATLLGLGSRGSVLLLSMHHIVSDGWSLQILHRDLAAAYEALERGRSPSLPVLRVQYPDFASWQRSRLSGGALDDLIAYWRTHLAGAPHQLELTANRHRSNAQGRRGGTHAFELDAEDVRALQALARGEGATLFMTALTVYMELIRRYSRRDDFLLAAPIGARHRAELEDVVGLFVNTLVLRADLSGDPSFREMLRRVREETLGAYAHADLPFERLVEELQPTRALGVNPLVQVAFGLHHADRDPGADRSSGAADGREPNHQPSVGSGTAKFDLSLVMTEVEGRLLAAVEYDRDLFDADTVTRMGAHFRSLARQAVRGPDVRLSDWTLVPDSEVRQLVGSWGRGPRRSTDVELSDLVALHARRDPARVAVEAPDGALGYAELDARTSRFAGVLRALGVAAEVPVGVCLGNSLHLPVSLVAIWRAGGAYVPLDPALPSARLAYLVRDASVQVLITDEAGARRLGGCGARIVCPDGLERLPAPEREVPVAADPSQIAYIIYTSGSTGHPKGVMLTRGGVRALLAAQSHGVGLTPADRVLKFAPIGFDASVFEMIMALAAGATLCLEPQDDLLPGPELAALVRRREITNITMPPSSLGVIPADGCDGLRLVFVAGEACPAELVARWAGRRRMINGYGPTETTVWATFAECVADGRAPAIGRPVANALVRILDRHLRPVPVGVAGELCIGGPFVARGYLGRPASTAASFIPDPWDAPGARMYRTGDLARWRADGSIEFLGRLDGQIKLRGVRIDPAEIEAAITALPGVAYCAVTLREDRPGHPALVAYVVPMTPAVLNGAAIRRSLQEQLPRYLVPSRVVLCDQLPRTSSGKVDRHALPAPPPMSEAPRRAPRSAVEDAVCRICADVLETPVERDDNFFELGGHSLLLTRVLSRIRDDLGIDISVGRMFEAATLAEFCDGLEARESPPTRIPRLPRRAGGMRGAPGRVSPAASSPVEPSVTPGGAGRDLHAPA